VLCKSEEMQGLCSLGHPADTFDGSALVSKRVNLADRTVQGWSCNFWRTWSGDAVREGAVEEHGLLQLEVLFFG
jgi:hypothetical protein